MQVLQKKKKTIIALLVTAAILLIMVHNLLMGGIFILKQMMLKTQHMFQCTGLVSGWIILTSMALVTNLVTTV